MLLKTSKEIYFLDMALRCAKQGNCLRRNYGSVLVDNYGCVVATGYTGVPKKRLHCVKCWRQENNIPSGRNYEKCRSVHSEMNAVIQAGKMARGCTLFLSGYDVATGNEILNPKPCFLCIKTLVNADVRDIIFKNENGDIVIADVIDMYNQIERETFIQDDKK